MVGTFSYAGGFLKLGRLRASVSARTIPLKRGALTQSHQSVVKRACKSLAIPNNDTATQSRPKTPFGTNARTSKHGAAQAPRRTYPLFRDYVSKRRRYPHSGIPTDSTRWRNSNTENECRKEPPMDAFHPALRADSRTVNARLHNGRRAWRSGGRMIALRCSPRVHRTFGGTRTRERLIRPGPVVWNRRMRDRNSESSERPILNGAISEFKRLSDALVRSRQVPRRKQIHARKMPRWRTPKENSPWPGAQTPRDASPKYASQEPYNRRQKKERREHNTRGPKGNPFAQRGLRRANQRNSRTRGLACKHAQDFAEMATAQ